MPMNFIVAELCINPFCAVLQATVRWVWWVVFSCPGRLLEMEPYLARQQVELEQVRADLNNAGAWGDPTISCRRRHFSCRISCNNERRGNRTVSDNPTQREKTFFQSVTLYNFVAYVEPSWSLLPSCHLLGHLLAHLLGFDAWSLGQLMPYCGGLFCRAGFWFRTESLATSE